MAATRRRAEHPRGVPAVPTVTDGGEGGDASTYVRRRWDPRSCVRWPRVGVSRDGGAGANTRCVALVVPRSSRGGVFERAVAARAWLVVGGLSLAAGRASACAFVAS